MTEQQSSPEQPESLPDAQIGEEIRSALRRMHRRVLELEKELAALTLSVPPRSVRATRTPEGVVAGVAAHYGVAVAELKGAARDKRTADARHVAAYLLREDLGLSFPAIGKILGGRDHSTIMSACEKIRGLVRKQAAYAQQVEAVSRKLA